jgi:hypothetical protein
VVTNLEVSSCYIKFDVGVHISTQFINFLNSSALPFDAASQQSTAYQCDYQSSPMDCSVRLQPLTCAPTPRSVPVVPSTSRILTWNHRSV